MYLSGIHNGEVSVGSAADRSGKSIRSNDACALRFFNSLMGGPRVRIIIMIFSHGKKALKDMERVVGIFYSFF